MSGNLSEGEPPDAEPPDRDTLAAEYVLGLLDPHRRRQVASAAERDSSLAGAVHAWSARLEPLASLAAPVAPSDGLWQRIARDLPRRDESVRPTRQAPGRLAWPVLGLGGYALAAGLAVALLLSRHRLDVRVAWDAPASPVVHTLPPPAPAAPLSAPAAPLSAPAAPRAAPPAPERAKPPAPALPPASRAVALLTASGGERPAMKAFFEQGGTVRLVPVQPVSVAPDKQLGFWVWPRGTALPIPLGRVDADGGTLRFPFHEADGTPVMVTLESRGLPVSDAQGPTLFTGQLVAID